MATEEDTGQATEEDAAHKDAEQQQDSDDDQQQDSDDNPERAGQLAEKPEVDESAKEKAKEMRKAYKDDIDTVALPGSDRTVTGTAVNEWLDDEGNPKFGQEGDKSENQSENQPEDKSESKSENQSDGGSDSAG